MTVPRVILAAGILLQPRPDLVVDACGQLVLRDGVELLVVVGDPLGAVPVDHCVVGLDKHIHPAGGHEGQMVVPVGRMVSLSLGALL